MSNLNKRIFLFIMMLGLVLGLASCTKPEDSVRIFFSENEYTVKMGQTRVLNPTVITSSKVENVELVYSSSNEDVVKYIDGKLIPVSMGTATIKVAWADRDIIFDKATVTVEKAVLPVPSVSYQASMLKGTSQTMVVTLNNNLSDATYAIEALTPEIATISETGVITAVAAGKAQFKVVVEDAEESAGHTYEIKVIESDYKINYVLDGGVNAESNPEGYSSLTDTVLAPATKVGYDFVAWKDAEGNAVEKIEKGTLGDVTLTATWSPVVYTVSVSGLEGATFAEGAALPTEYTIESAEIVLATPEKVGYTFLGYFTAEGVKVEKIATGSHGNLVLTVRWEATKYSVTVNGLEGATFAEGAALPTEYTIESAEIVLATPTKVGATFSGYFTAEGVKVEKIATGSHGNLVLTAKWDLVVYTVSVSGLEGATFAEGASLPTEYTIESAEIVLATPEKVGYTFLGYFNAEGAKVEKIATGSHGNLVLTARWEVTKYSVTVNGLEGATFAEGAALPTEYTIESAEIVLATPTKAGATFLGYFTAEDVKVEKIETGSHGDLVLTAKWDLVVYTISYDVDGVKTGWDLVVAEYMKDFSAFYGTEFTRPEEAMKNSKGLNFWKNSAMHDKWVWIVKDIRALAKAQGIDTQYLDNLITGAGYSGYALQCIPVYLVGTNANGWNELYKAENGALSSKWTTVNATTAQAQAFRANNSWYPQQFTVDTLATLTVKGLSRAHFDFLGWFEGETKVESFELRNYELVAKFSPIPVYTISWELNGASWEDGFTPVTSFERDQVVTLPTPVKAYHTFLGWYQGEVKVEAIGNENYELVAQWKDERITGETTAFVFNLEGGEFAEGQNPYVDSSVLANILNLKPVKEGCRFVKWETEVNNTTTPATTIYTAVWEEVGFTISYDLAGGEWEDGFTPVTEFERDQVVTLSTPVKAEHTFLGWYQGDVKVEAIGNSNYELVAKWQVNEYTITYQFDGGDWATSGISDHAGFVEAFLVDYEAYIKGLGWKGEAISRTEDPAHAADFMGVSYGYAAATEAFFKTDATYSAKWGWMLTFLTSKGADLSSTTLIRSNVHAFLHLTKWEKWPYSVDLSGVQFEEYSSNLPTGTKQEGPTKYVAGAEIVLPALVKEGKVFKGWSLSADLSNPFTTLPVGTTGNIVLFAVFE